MSDIIHEDDQQITFSTGHRLRQALEHYKIFCRLPADKGHHAQNGAYFALYTVQHLFFFAHDEGWLLYYGADLIDSGALSLGS
jgi:hypothetical protein